ncbi:MAG: hypothetical protein R2720_14760 [Candidatus Nanopelagicales bacterium]
MDRLDLEARTESADTGEVITRDNTTLRTGAITPLATGRAGLRREALGPSGTGGPDMDVR